LRDRTILQVDYKQKTSSNSSYATGSNQQVCAPLQVPLSFGCHAFDQSRRDLAGILRFLFFIKQLGQNAHHYPNLSDYRRTVLAYHRLPCKVSE